MKRPIWVVLIVLVFLVVAAIFVATVTYVGNRSTTITLEDEKMNFTWNKQTKTLESDQANVSVLVMGDYMGRTDDQYVLSMNDRKFGFTTKSGAGLSSDGRRVWEVNKLCITIFRGGRQGKTYSHKTEFADFLEQEKAIAAIEAALSVFFDMSHDNKKISAIVKFTDEIRNKLANGDFVAGN